MMMAADEGSSSSSGSSSGSSSSSFLSSRMVLLSITGICALLWMGWDSKTLREISAVAIMPVDEKSRNVTNGGSLFSVTVVKKTTTNTKTTTTKPVQQQPEEEEEEDGEDDEDDEEEEDVEEEAEEEDAEKAEEEETFIEEEDQPLQEDQEEAVQATQTQPQEEEQEEEQEESQQIEPPPEYSSQPETNPPQTQPEQQPKRKKRNKRQKRKPPAQEQPQEKNPQTPALVVAKEEEEEKVVNPIIPPPPQTTTIIPPTTTTILRNQSAFGIGYMRENWQWVLTDYELESKKQKQQETRVTEDPNILLTSQGLRQQLDLAVPKLKTKLQQLYGDYYQSFFEPKLLQPSTIGNHHVHKSPTAVLQYVQTSSPDNNVNNNNLPPSLATTRIQPPPTSTNTPNGWNGIVRKLQIKLLQAQLGIIQAKQLNQQPSDQTSPDYYSKFVWMTGGDRWAGGFGNLLHQTYTNVLAEVLQPLFASLAIDFEAKDHSIVGQFSAPELALCGDQIYGTDYDLLVWDFEQGDEQFNDWRKAYYAHRAAVTTTTSSQHKSLPIVLYNGIFAKAKNSFGKSTLQLLSNLEQLGLPVLVRDQLVEVWLERQIPDSNPLGSEAAVKAKLPPNLQFYKCGRKESGGYCKKYMFDNTKCPKRTGKKDWFLGWKANALKGYTLALTMMELLSAAIDAIEKEEASSSSSATAAGLKGKGGGNLEKRKQWITQYLTKLVQEEEIDYQKFTTGDDLGLTATTATATTTTGTSNLNVFPKTPQIGTVQNLFKDPTTIPMDLPTLFRAPAFCRTPLMPSDSRLRGIFSDNSPVVPYGQGYYKGIGIMKIRKAEINRQTSFLDEVEGDDQGDGAAAAAAADDNNNNEDFILATSNQEKDNPCPPDEHVRTPSQRSFRDWYHISNLEGRRTITIPNNAEQQVYTNFFGPQHVRQGWIFLCLNGCPSKNSCTEDLIFQNQPNDTTKGIRIETTINGVAVTGYKSFLWQSGYCRAMTHGDDSSGGEKNQFVWKPNQEGRYDISVEIHSKPPNTATTSLRITSFILM